LEALKDQFENAAKAKVLSAQGQHVGDLCVEVWPLAKDGSEDIPDDEIADDPQELVGQPFTARMKIKGIEGLATSKFEQARVTYCFAPGHDGLDGTVEVGPISLSAGCGNFEFSKDHEIASMTSGLLAHFEKNEVLLAVYGILPGGRESDPAADIIAQTDKLMATLSDEDRAQFEGPEFSAKCEELFKNADKDNSGFLDGEELRTTVVELFPDSQKDAVKDEFKLTGIPFLTNDLSMADLTRAFDKNKDGKIGPDEFPAFVKFSMAARLHSYFTTPAAPTPRLKREDANVSRVL
jgi:hypothetical protein